ncbi:MAG: hypothetical protein K0S04_1041 [Herbinix sp.]|jgi:hypothetical protein|nr:hypothetical protein [Herbinix sp.]
MIKNVFNLLRNNPVIIAFHLIYELLLILIVVLLYPTNMNQFMGNENFDIAAYFMMLIKMLSACGLLFLISIIFMPGYGHMLSEAIIQGKTSAKSFLEGINRFFVRFLLLTLLGTAAAFAFSIIISIILVPITMIQVIGGDPSGLVYTSVFITILILLITILIIPFVLLCIPSILMDDVKIFQGIKIGAKAGVKNYWKLVIILLTTYLPIIFYQIIYYDSVAQGEIITPSYIVLLIICGIISLFIIPMLFLVYKEYRMKQIDNDNTRF